MTPEERAYLTAKAAYEASQDAPHELLDEGLKERARLYREYNKARWAWITAPHDLRTPAIKAMNARGIKTGNAVNEAPDYGRDETQLDATPLMSRSYDNPLQGSSLPDYLTSTEALEDMAATAFWDIFNVQALEEAYMRHPEDD